MNAIEHDKLNDAVKRYYVVKEKPGNMSFRMKGIGVVLALIILSNVITHSIFSSEMNSAVPAPKESLYLLDYASVYVEDVRAFEDKVEDVASRLEVPAEWLMAVMYSESKFDASVSNHRGSGATGLIQWMPATAKELNTSVGRLRNLNHVDQMDYVYRYLDMVRDRYGDYQSLTDLYLAILYPKARTADYCYTLYAKPSQAYKQNVGLDEDVDGRVTVSDIDKRLKRIYPTAYFAK